MNFILNEQTIPKLFYFYFMFEMSGGKRSTLLKKLYVIILMVNYNSLLMMCYDTITHHVDMCSKYISACWYLVSHIIICKIPLLFHFITNILTLKLFVIYVSSVLKYIYYICCTYYVN